MERDADPATHFFPDGNVDLYGALGVEKEAGADEIKKAYRKLALRYHPDKIALTATKDAQSSSSSAPSTSAADLQQRFQQINYAYTVLSDEKRRKRYDDTGRTDEGMDDVNWEEWVKDFGKIDADKLDKFKSEYQHSDEERQDLLDAYVQAEGNLEEIFTLVPCSEVLVDEERFVKTIEEAIKAGEVEELGGWKTSKGEEGKRKKMREKAKKEANEAEEYAKELGVWDDLFGGKKGGDKAKKATDEDTKRGSSSKKAQKKKGADEEESEAEVEGDASSDEDEGDDDDDEEEDEQPKRKSRKVSSDSKKGKAKASASTASSSRAGKSTNGSPSTSSSTKGKAKTTSAAQKKGKKSAADDAEGEGDLAGLEALFAKRQAQRSAGFDDMIARMEARAKSEGSGGGKKGKKNGSGSKKKRGHDDDDDDDDVGGPAEDEPDEEAFLKARAAVDARRAAGGASADAGSSSSTSSKKKSKK